jgi:hypothetical protein
MNGTPQMAMSRTQLFTHILLITIFVISPLFASAEIKLTRKQGKLYVSIYEIFSHNRGFNQEVAAYFAVMAEKSGVRSARAMRKSEKPKISHPKQTGCGRANLSTKEILVDTSRKFCANVHNLIHEITHIAVLRQNCRGHGDNFYRKNYQLAQEAEQAFPFLKRRPYELAAAVIKRSIEYRSEENRCKGGKPFPN